jgi:hypothetical protein
MKIDKQNRALIFTLFFQLWRLVSGPITMLLIPLFLSEIQQGYWYLFGSLSALSVFADLGFGNIILQFSSHEYAFLKFTNDGFLDGSETYLLKLGSFFRFMIKWILIMCSFVFPVIYIIGYIYFFRDGVVNVYLLPWIFFLIGSLISFFNNAILYFIEGLDRLGDAQKMRLKVAIFNTVIISITLILRGNIYALVFGTLSSAILNSLLIIINFRKIINQLVSISQNKEYSWKKEVVPLFAKYAISFSCGFFTSSIYVPLAHYFYGPLFSGKVGISLALANAIYAISYVWLYSIAPMINIYISKKNWNSLDILFNKRLLFSNITYLILSIIIIMFFVIFPKNYFFGKIFSRFLPIQALVILLLCYMFLISVSAWALYLRGHKKEPYLVSSLIQAGFVIVSTMIIGKVSGIKYFFGGYFISFLIIIPLNYKIYRKYKLLWHMNNE